MPVVMQGKEGTGTWEERGRAAGTPLLQGVAAAALEKGWRGSGTSLYSLVHLLPLRSKGLKFAF